MKQKYYDGDFVYYTHNADLHGIRSGTISSQTLPGKVPILSYTLTTPSGQRFGRIRENHITKRLPTAKKRVFKMLERQRSQTESSIRRMQNALIRLSNLTAQTEAYLG